MAAWMETVRSVVSPWECDVTEHFTIAYYFDRLADAASTIAESLGLPDPVDQMHAGSRDRRARGEAGGGGAEAPAGDGDARRQLLCRGGSRLGDPRRVVEILQHRDRTVVMRTDRGLADFHQIERGGHVFCGLRLTLSVTSR